MSVFDSADAWVASHQALVVAVGIPLLTALAAAIVSYFTNRANLKSHAADRALQARIRLFDERSNRIDRLRSALARFEGLRFFAAIDFGAGLSSGTPQTLTREKATKFTEELTNLMAEIGLLIDAGYEEAKQLDDVMKAEISSVLSNGEIDGIELEKRFFPTSRRLIEKLLNDARRDLRQ